MISVQQWRATIGCYSPKLRESTVPIHKIIITRGNTPRLCVRLLIILAIHLALSNDVETNPGPTQSQAPERDGVLTSANQKRDRDTADLSPGEIMDHKRLDQRPGPSGAMTSTQPCSGPAPPVFASLVSVANENHPLYTPGRPAVFLSLDSGELSSKTPARRSLDSGETVVKTPARRSLVLDHASTRPTTPAAAPTQTPEPECEPEWAQKLMEMVVKMGDRIKTLEQAGAKTTTLETKVYSLSEQTDLELKKTREQIARMEKLIERQSEEIGRLRDQLLSEQTRSMRSNLIFSGIPETDRNENCESIVREFISHNMGVDDRDIPIERSHRLGPRQRGKNRPIVTKFLNFKDKETIRQAAPKTLRNTKYGVNEQFPKEIADRRKLLIPILKAEKSQQRRANLVVDKLYTEEATFVVRGDQVDKINNRRNSRTANIPTQRNTFYNYQQQNINQNRHQGQHYNSAAPAYPTYRNQNNNEYQPMQDSRFYHQNTYNTNYPIWPMRYGMPAMNNTR